jgi:S1-C subfamily serine protease
MRLKSSYLTRLAGFLVALLLVGCAGSDWDQGLHKLVRVPRAVPLIDEALGDVSVSGATSVMSTTSDGMGGLMIRQARGVDRADVEELIKGELLRAKIFFEDDGKRPRMSLGVSVINHGGNVIGSEFHISLRYVLKNYKDEVILDKVVSSTGEDGNLFWAARVIKGQMAAIQKNINGLVDYLDVALPRYAQKRGPRTNVADLKEGDESNEPKPKTPSRDGVQATTGSGFFVSKLGHVVTNEHVVRGCKTVSVGDNSKKQAPAKIISTDKLNDLALLKLSSLDMASDASKSLIRKLGIKVVPLAANGLLRSRDVKLGEQVLVAGYPYGDIFSDTIKVTSGIVSATRGSGDNSAQFQLDAAVQSGNSGGPIYDSGGNIVGVVVSQLNKLKVAKAIGTLPENVNFGIKASTVRTFLTSSGLPSKIAKRTADKSTVELAEIAQKQALMVLCSQ